MQWYSDVPAGIREKLGASHLGVSSSVREVGKKARAPSRLSKMSMKSSEFVRRYGQRVKALIHKLTIDIASNVQVEWYVARFPKTMGFQIRQTRSTTLREEMDTAHNYKN